MEKNDYLLINDSIYQLYSCETLIEAKATLLNRLKLITNYTYASIMMSVQIDNERRLADPFCNPKSFESVEQEYIKMESLDHTNWINYSTMSELIHESDIMEDSKMFTTPIYEKCYKKYNIYDMVQLSIVYNEQTLGILTLYRTKDYGKFTSDELFFLRSLSKHINLVFHRFIDNAQVHHEVSPIRLPELADLYSLTKRETEILGLVLQEEENSSIAQSLQISEFTLQKHLQNIYKKTDVSSKWGLLKLR